MRARPLSLTAATLVLALALLPASAAHAKAPRPHDFTQAAKLHFEIGRDHVQKHEYEDAIREFEAGYHLKPMPLFLYNIGIVAKAAGLHEKALDAFERYQEAEPESPDRAEVERSIALLRRSVTNERVAHPDARTLEPDAAAPPPAAAPALTADSAAPAPTAAPPHKSHKTLWIVLGVVGGALVAGGVATGLAVGLRGNGGSNVPSGFHDLGGLPLGAH